MASEEDGDGSDDAIFSTPYEGTKISGTETDEDNSLSPKDSSDKKNKLVQKTASIKDCTSFKSESAEKGGSMRKQKGTVSIYQCNLCCFQSANRLSLNAHAKNCTQSRPKKFWECPKCNRKYELQDLLDMLPGDLSSLDEHVFHCPACSTKEALDGSEFTILEKLHPANNKPTKCPCCNVKIQGFTLLKKHLATEHDVTIKYRCEFCEYFSSDSESLREHKVSHTNVQEMGLIQCSHCLLNFPTIREFKDHMSRVEREKQATQGKEEEQKVEVKTEQKVENVLLGECAEEKVKVEPSGAGSMMSDTTGIGKWQLKCTLCQYINYSKASCERHVKNKHRPSGHAVVTFDKYYDHQFKGSVKIGKIKDDKDNGHTSTQELLKILDWTESDEVNILENTPPDTVDGSEVITIQMTSDTDDIENEDVKGKTIKEETTVDHTMKKGPLDCNACDYKAKNKLHFSIHQQLIHELNEDNYAFKCPKRGCKFTASARYKLRSHLKKYHKVKLDIFYPKELKCPDCIYTAKQPHHLLIHRRYVHMARSSRTLNKPVSAATRTHFKLRENIVQKMGETDVQCSTLSCKHCGVKYQEMYQLGWHMLKSHGDNSEIQKWRLKCKVCSYENYSKLDCHRHGLQHKMSPVRFDKYYSGRLKGAIGFRYKDVQRNNANLQQSTVEDQLAETHKEPLAANSDNETVISNKNKNRSKKKKGKAMKFDDTPDTKDGSIKSLDSTRSADENVVKRKSNSSNDDESNGRKELKNDDVLLTKNSEFYTCSQCDYETEHESYLPMHEQLVHGDPISRGANKYQCRECDFTSVYRHSLKRHLDRVHSYNVDEFYTQEQIKSSTRKSKDEIEESVIVKVDKSPAYVCQLCSYKFVDKYMMDWHLFKLHRNKSEILKWKIRCRLCSYETYSKKYAQCHAAGLHSSRTRAATVKFDKYFENELQGKLTFTVGKSKTYRCTNCAYVTTKWENLKQHYKIHRTQTGMKTRLRQHKEIVEDKEEINSEEIQRDEIIKIEITPGSDDEANDSQDFSQNDEFTEWSIQSNEHLGDSKRLKPAGTKQATDHEELASEIDDDDNAANSTKGPRESDGESGKVNTESKPVRRSKRQKAKTSTTKVDSKDSSENEHTDLDQSDDVTNVEPDLDEDVDEGNDSDDSWQKAEDQRDEGAIKYFSNGVRNYKKDLPPNMRYVLNQCVHPGCEYQSSDKCYLRTHCLKVHKHDRKELDAIFLELNQYECCLCRYQSPYRKQMSVHMGSSHKVNSGYCAACTQCATVYKDRYQYASHMFTVHSDKTELNKWSIRCTLCSYENSWIKNAGKHGVAMHSSSTAEVVVTFNKFYENNFEGVYTCRCKMKRPHRCQQCNFVTETWDGLKKHMARHKKPNFVPAHHRSGQKSKPVRSRKRPRKEAESDSDTHVTTDSEIDSYSKQRIMDIIGLSSPGTEKKEIKTVEATGDSTEEFAESNEVITIEITPDADAEITRNKETTALNPFTGEFIMEVSDDENTNVSQTGNNIEISFDKSTKFRCKNAGCKYTSNSSKKITDHISYCTQNNPRKTIEDGKAKGVVTKYPPKVSYKCGLCGFIFVTKATLENHTSIHAREDQDFNIKVRYSKFLDDKLVGTIIISADPNFVSRKKKPAKVPELEYDPTLPVFGCHECNFKTNEEGALKKHKGLHWTPQKAALFKAQKFFTCSTCFFHCFEVEQFKEHCEWHKKHNTPTVGIGKLGTNSWFLK